MRASHLLARDEPCRLQHLHVLRSAGESHAIGLGEIADRGFAERELRQHAAPRRIGQRVEDGVEPNINHVVEYRGPTSIVNRSVEYNCYFGVDAKLDRMCAPVRRSVISM